MHMSGSKGTIKTTIPTIWGDGYTHVSFFTKGDKSKVQDKERGTSTYKEHVLHFFS